MPKFSVVFIAPEEKKQLKHKILEAADQDEALRTFFDEEAKTFYSEDEQGFFYFKEDFFYAESPSGSILSCD